MWQCWSLLLLLLKAEMVACACRSSQVTVLTTWEELEDICGPLEETIPESIGLLTKLVRLELRSRQLQSLPESFGQLTDLTDLNLSNNSLQALPESFGKLTRLRKLEIIDNQLQSLPESFVHLTALRELDLSNNFLQSLPESFGQLTGLWKVFLNYNQLQTLPESFGQLRFMNDLALNNNQLLSLPESFIQLNYPRRIRINNNRLQSLPESLGRLRSIDDLEFQNNQLKSLPESFGQLTRIKFLHLNDNQLQSLPESFGELTALLYLNLSYNELEILPESFGQLTMLGELSLENNRLTSLPESFSNLRGTTLVSLHNNPFVCDRLSLAWSIGIDFRSLSDTDGTKCDTVNEFAGFPIHRIRFQEDEPESTPKVIEIYSDSPNKLFVSWDYLSSSKSRSLEVDDSSSSYSSLYLSSYSSSDKSGGDDMYISSQTEQIYSQEGEAVPQHNFSGAVFDCGSIGVSGKEKQPTLIFEVEWRNVEETESSWTSTCTSITNLAISDLVPNSVYDVRVRAVNVRWDVHIDRILFGPRLSAGPRSLTSRVKTQSEAPEVEPVLNALLPRSPNDVSVSWTFSSSRSLIRKTPDHSFPGTVFDCDLSGEHGAFVKQPTLIFQVEWRRDGGEIVYPWETLCTTNTDLRISGLVPNSVYDINVRAGHVRWDVAVTSSQNNQTIGFRPRLSKGPKSFTSRVKTQPGVPEGTPQNLEQDFNVTRETLLAIRWDPPPVPNADKIYYTVRMNDKVVAEFIEETILTIDSLEPGSLYSIMVRASSEAGWGNFSKPLQARTISRCRRGFQRRESEGYVCKPCPQDTYRDDELSKDCAKCPLDRPHTLSTGSTSNADCVDGSLFLELEAHSNTQEDRLVKDGFWRISNRTMDFHACPRIDYCKPKKRLATWFWNSSDQYCSPGHIGVLCSMCEDGFGLKEVGCEKCDEKSKARDHRMLTLWALVGAFVVLAPCLLIVAHLLKPADTSSTSLCFSCWQPDIKMMEDIAVVVRVFVGFFQVFLQYTRATGMDALIGQGSLELAVNLDLGTFLRRLGVACVWVTTFYDGLLLYTLFPLVAVMLMYSVVACAWRAPRKASALGLAVWTTMQLMFFVYPGVSSTIFNTFRYATFWTGPDLSLPSRTLAVDYSVDFDTEESKCWRLFAGLMIAVYPVGVVALFCVMVRVGKKLANKTCKSDVEESVSDAVAFLSRPYTWAYFECYELLRKLMLTSGFLLVQQESEQGAKVFFVLMCMFFTNILLGVRPYISPVTFSFAIVSAALLVLIGFVPLCLIVIKEMIISTAEALTMWIAMAECVAFVATIGGHIWFWWRRERKALGKCDLQDKSPCSDEDDCENHASGEFAVVND